MRPGKARSAQQLTAPRRSHLDDEVQTQGRVVGPVAGVDSTRASGFAVGVTVVGRVLGERHSAAPGYCGDTGRLGLSGDAVGVLVIHGSSISTVKPSSCEQTQNTVSPRRLRA
jgi:hypothetical protein